MKLTKIMALILSVMFIVACMGTAAYAAEYRVGGTKGATDISEAYAKSIFYDRFKKITLTGDGRIDTVAIALSQIGYQEGNDESQFSGTYAGSNNFTEFNWNMGDYGSGYGGDYAWCASFVSFALFQAGTHDYSKLSDISRYHVGDNNYIWREIGCQKWREQLDAAGYLKDGAAHGGNYVPVTGDLIFFGSKYSHSSHIGLVVYCEGNTVYTVEGNTNQAAGLETNGGGVYFKSYDLSNSRILGYGVLPYKTNSEAIAPDYSCKKLTTGLYVNTNYQNTGIEKQVYKNAECTSNYIRIGLNDMFEILEFVSENVAKVKFYQKNASAFREVEGYIKLDDGAKLVSVVSYGVGYDNDPVDPPVEQPTETPTTETPTEAPTEEPTTEAPTTEEPTTEESTTEAPTEETTTEAPTEETTTETPTDEPATEAPTDEPATEAPTEEPATEPVTEEPATEPATEQKTEAPTSEPKADVPTTGNDVNAKGCGSTIGGVSAIVVAVATTCALYTKKKKRR